MANLKPKRRPAKGLSRIMSYTYKRLKDNPQVLKYQKVEHWNHWAKIRQDLFHLIDVLALTPTGIWGIQTTSHSNNLAHIKKALAEGNLEAWLKAGGKFTIWSWLVEKVKRRNNVILVETHFFFNSKGKLDISTPSAGHYANTLQKYRERYLHVPPEESTRMVLPEPEDSRREWDLGATPGTCKL